MVKKIKLICTFFILCTNIIIAQVDNYTTLTFSEQSPPEYKGGLESLFKFIFEEAKLTKSELDTICQSIRAYKYTIDTSGQVVNCFSMNNKNAKIDYQETVISKIDEKIINAIMKVKYIKPAIKRKNEKVQVDLVFTSKPLCRYKNSKNIK